MSPVSFLLHNASLSTQSSKSFYNADLIKFTLVITYILESKPWVKYSWFFMAPIYLSSPSTSCAIQTWRLILPHDLPVPYTQRTPGPFWALAHSGFFPQCSFSFLYPENLHSVFEIQLKYHCYRGFFALGFLPPNPLALHLCSILTVLQT